MAVAAATLEVVRPAAVTDLIVALTGIDPVVIVAALDQIDAAGVLRLSKMPGLLELRSQLLALIQTPATTLVRLLGTPGTQVARAIDAHREKQGGGGE